MGIYIHFDKHQSVNFATNKRAIHLPSCTAQIPPTHNAEMTQSDCLIYNYLS